MDAERIGTYSRQSTENDDQVAEHTRWCRERVERDGGVVVGPFEDDGISGFKLKRRPGFLALIEAIKARLVDAIMAVTFDRLTRNARDEAFALLDALDAAGITMIYFIDEADIELSTASGRRDYMDRANSAWFYSARLGEKVRDANYRIARAGRWCGAAPYGYATVDDHPSRRDGLTLVENPAEADVIREAVAAVKAGDSVNLIAMRLRARGSSTGWGKPWNSKALRRVLLSPAIAGLPEYREEVLRDETGAPLPVEWEPIISAADHELLKERLASNHVDRHPDAVNLRHPLAGILRCGRVLTEGPRRGEVCGTPMYGATLKNGTVRYACSTERGGCGGVTVSAKYVEAYVLGHVMGYLLTERKMPIGDGVAPEVHETAAAELSAIARDRAQLNALRDSKMFTATELKPKFADLKRRERRAKANLARPVSVEFDGPRMGATLDARYDAYLAGDRDAAGLLHDEISHVIDSIVVDPIKTGARRNVFDFKRLTIYSKVPFPKEDASDARGNLPAFKMAG